MIFNGSNRWAQASLKFWLLTLFLLIVFVSGGSSRLDVQSLVFLRPISVIACGIAIWSLSKENLIEHKLLSGFALAIFVLVICQLIPVPDALLNQLPQGELARQVRIKAGVDVGPMPVSVVPLSTWNALYSLFIPLAVFLFGIQLRTEEKLLLVPVVLALGLVSGLLGLLQSISDPSGPLYLYRITNNGAAVGFFANRNHQAVLLALLFPMLAVYASVGSRTKDNVRFKMGLAVAAGALLVPLLLVTGSRAGLIAGILGLLSAFFLYRKPPSQGPKKRKIQRLNPAYVFGPIFVLILSGVTVIMARAQALQRLAEGDPTDDLRFRWWGPIAEAASTFLPWGSGQGTFPEVYRWIEPASLLQTAYVNRAHNDWLELYLSSGLPGLVLLLIMLSAVFYAFFGALKPWRGDGQQKLPIRLGVFIIFIIALASMVDYPLRTPTVSALCVLAFIWISPGWQKSPSNAEIDK